MKRLLYHILKSIKTAGSVLLLLLTFKSDDAVNAGICDYSGQGRDQYGR